MRPLLLPISALALGLAGAPAVLAEPRSEPPLEIGVPRLDRAELDPREHTPHELILPADVVARPGESPAEALARALAAQDDE